MPELDLTLPAILAGGAVAAAAFITGLTEVLKRLVRQAIHRELDAQLTAAILAAVLVAAALTGVPLPATVNGWAGLALSAVLSWYGIMRISMGIYDDLAANPGSLTARPSALEPAPPAEEGPQPEGPPP